MTPRTIERAKVLAKGLRAKAREESNPNITLSACQAAIAAGCGANDWHDLSERLKRQEQLPEFCGLRAAEALHTHHWDRLAGLVRAVDEFMGQIADAPRDSFLKLIRGFIDMDAQARDFTVEGMRDTHSAYCAAREFLAQNKCPANSFVDWEEFVGEYGTFEADRDTQRHHDYKDALEESIGHKLADDDPRPQMVADFMKNPSPSVPGFEVLKEFSDDPIGLARDTELSRKWHVAEMIVRRGHHYFRQSAFAVGTQKYRMSLKLTQNYPEDEDFQSYASLALIELQQEGGEWKLVGLIGADNFVPWGHDDIANPHSLFDELDEKYMGELYYEIMHRHVAKLGFSDDFSGMHRWFERLSIDLAHIVLGPGVRILPSYIDVVPGDALLEAFLRELAAAAEDDAEFLEGFNDVGLFITVDGAPDRELIERVAARAGSPLLVASGEQESSDDESLDG